MQIRESGEMYLEAIFILKKNSSDIRSIDIVNYTGYTKPSVSRAVGLLKDRKYIEIDNDGYINFTKIGKDIASSIYEKHTTLTNFFVNLGVNKEIAAQDACKIEHYISDETFNAIKEHISKSDF